MAIVKKIPKETFAHSVSSRFVHLPFPPQQEYNYIGDRSTHPLRVPQVSSGISEYGNGFPTVRFRSSRVVVGPQLSGSSPSTISRGESWPAAEREGGDEMWSEREARRHSQKRLQHVGSSNRWSRSIIRENNNFGNRV